MPDAYLTPEDAETRLAAYGITATPSEARIALASDALDLKAPFVGCRYDEEQYRAFPRSVTIRDDVEGEVPEAILDWVALTAYELTRPHEPPVIQEAVGKLQARYTVGRQAMVPRLKKNLLRLYRDPFIGTV